MLPTDTPHSFPPMYLISESRLGRRGLLLSSSSSMALSSLALGLGILYAVPWLSAVALVAVVAGFSIGLGPVPFLILPELVEPRVRLVCCMRRTSLTSSPRRRALRRRSASR
jgi:MFS family permease